MTAKKEVHDTPADDHVSLGSYLAAERLKREVSIEEMGRRTGIHLSILRALEADERRGLPAPVFVRGFIKLYADELGLDSEYALALYQEDPERRRMEPLVGPDILSSETLAESPIVTRKRILFLLLALLFGILVIVGMRFAPRLPFLAGGSHKESVAPKTPAVADSVPLPRQSATAEPQAPPAPPEQADVTAAAPESLPPASRTPAYVLEARFTDMTWMRIDIDGQEPQEAFFKAGSSYSWQADNQFDIILGNAGGVTLQLNGKPVTIAGKSGQVVKLTLPQTENGDSDRY